MYLHEQTMVVRTELTAQHEMSAHTTFDDELYKTDEHFNPLRLACHPGLLRIHYLSGGSLLDLSQGNRLLVCFPIMINRAK